MSNPTHTLPEAPNAPDKDRKGGCSAVAGSRLVLQVRFHDRDHGWQEWETIEGRQLEEKYGTTPDQWKLACAGWIEIGGRYEYRILRVSETIDWSISFAENNKTLPTEGAAQDS